MFFIHLSFCNANLPIHHHLLFQLWTIGLACWKRKKMLNYLYAIVLYRAGSYHFFENGSENNKDTFQKMIEFLPPPITYENSNWFLAPYNVRVVRRGWFWVRAIGRAHDHMRNFRSRIARDFARTKYGSCDITIPFNERHKLIKFLHVSGTGWIVVEMHQGAVCRGRLVSKTSFQIEKTHATTSNAWHMEFWMKDIEEEHHETYNWCRMETKRST